MRPFVGGGVAFVGAGGGKKGVVSTGNFARGLGGRLERRCISSAQRASEPSAPQSSPAVWSERRGGDLLRPLGRLAGWLAGRGALPPWPGRASGGVGRRTPPVAVFGDFPFVGGVSDGSGASRGGGT
mmetsp:Transcript_14379/g.21620  ORF Transcript_14379/g.21620 Transcript_14379/m.21620 type:complete len:127 (-) Transcript_14379:136-516(-)